MFFPLNVLYSHVATAARNASSGYTCDAHGRHIPHPLVVRHPTPYFPWSYEQHRAHTPFRPSTACACGEDPEKAPFLLAQSHGAAAVKRVPARATTARRSTHECPPVDSCAKKKRQWRKKRAQMPRQKKSAPVDEH
ncbi:hypothetical protein TcCL_ESM08757 [Trypanosoma cruzi]|nr:hypothetical protein TcCL_ESM08757 [Trypanosoma cruzi]